MIGGPLDRVPVAPVRPPIGSIVHVLVHYPAGTVEPVCHPAITMQHAGEQLLARVLRHAPVTEPVGSQDEEAWFRPGWDAIVVESSDGTTRELDSWHWPYHAGDRP